LLGYKFPMGSPMLKATTVSEAAIMQGYSASQSLNIVDERPGDELGNYNPSVDGSGTGR
jgi:hypothetical protein